jgi:hypothetical protein
VCHFCSMAVEASERSSSHKTPQRYFLQLTDQAASSKSRVFFARTECLFLSCICAYASSHQTPLVRLRRGHCRYALCRHGARG